MASWSAEVEDRINKLTELHIDVNYSFTDYTRLKTLTDPDRIRGIHCLLVVGEILTRLMQEVMEIPNLPHQQLHAMIFSSNKFKKLLTQHEIELLNTLLINGFSKLDINLMYKIAKFFKIFFIEPTQSWIGRPQICDISLGDDMQRIKIAHDVFRHNICPLQTATEMEEFFKTFVAVGKRADAYLNKTADSSYEKSILNRRTCSLDPEREQHILDKLSNTPVKTMTDPDRIRGIRCSLVVGDILTRLMQEVMERSNVSHTTLHAVIFSSSKFKKLLKHHEINLLNTLLTDGFSKLDINLMYKIAKFFKIFFIEPTQSWSGRPQSCDITVGDDIQRIKRAHDFFCHNICPLQSATEMEEFFETFVAVGKRADAYLDKTADSSYEKSIVYCKTCSLDSDELSRLTTEEKRQCLEHRKYINYVCTDHRKGICDECLGIYHKQCSILDTISALACYEKLRQSIKSELKKELKKLENINSDLNEELSGSNELIISIVSNLQKTYDAMKEQYKQTIKQNEYNLLSALKELEERKRNIEKILDNVNDIQLDLSTIDNLLSIYKLKKLAEENIENFEKMCKKASLAKVNQNVYIVAAESKKRFIDFALYPIRENIYLNISLALLKSISVKPYRELNFIRGCTFGSNDDLCFVDARNDRLVIANSNDEQSTIPLPGRPFDVKYGDQDLIVTLRQNRSICFVHQVPNANPILSAVEVKFRDTGSIGGISRAEDHVVLAIECFGFYILDLKGEIKNEIKIKDDINIQYVASFSSKIFYTKSDENRVYCCNYAGDTLWMFEDDIRMKTPTGITVDEDGFVYVSCLNSNNVIVISPDGQFGKELISHINDLKRIHAIDYDVFGKKLLICSEHGHARVYKLQKSTLA